MKTEFLHKLLRRTDKLDKEHVLDVLLDVVEERNLLRALFDSIQDGVVFVSHDNTVGYINDAASRIFGVASDSANCHLDKVITSSELLKLCSDNIDSNTSFLNREIEAGINGTKRIIRVSLFPLVDKESRTLGAIILFVDITEQRLQEARLRRAEKLAALTTLSAGITHEIRNPLNALSIHLQILKRQLSKTNCANKAEMESTIGVLDREVTRLNEVIELFLKATRPTQPEFHKVRLYDLITETLQLMSPELERQKIDVQLITDAEQIEILADDRLLRQVFINLLKNAIEAIEEAVQELGEDSPRRIMFQIEADKSTTVIHLRDTGGGILQEDVQRIFEPYYTTKESGTGLGLMVTEGIIRQHGGQLDVHSQVGVGTEITITLPPPLEPTRYLKDETQETVT